MVGADLLVAEQGGLARVDLEDLSLSLDVRDVPGDRGLAGRCADTPMGRCRSSGTSGVEDPDEQVLGADGVLVVGAGGSGDDDHLTGLGLISSAHICKYRLRGDHDGVRGLPR